MTEQEKRRALIEWKEVWKDLLEKLEIKKEDLELEAIDVDEKNEAFLLFMDNYITDKCRDGFREGEIIETEGSRIGTVCSRSK